MVIFQMREVVAAYTHSKDGGQALHLHTLTAGHPLFKRYSEVAHLLDMNKERLIETAKKLGVRTIKVEHEGTIKQHIDLCGKPLERAKLQAQRQSKPKE